MLVLRKEAAKGDGPEQGEVEEIEEDDLRSGWTVGRLRKVFEGRRWGNTIESLAIGDLRPI